MSGNARRDIFGGMKNSDKLDLRVPVELRSALERERKRMAKALGTDVKMSTVVRSLLERALKRRSVSSERAA